MPVIADRLEEVSNLYLLLKQVSFRFVLSILYH